MSFFNKIFRDRKQQTDNKQPQSHQQPQSAPEQHSSEMSQKSRDAERVREGIEVNMKLVRYLATCGEFDREKMATYLSLSDQLGMQRTEREKNQMLNAGSFVFSERRSDGTMVMSGWDRVRMSIFEGHMDVIKQLLHALKALPPEPANIELTIRFIDEAKELGNQIKF